VWILPATVSLDVIIQAMWDVSIGLCVLGTVILYVGLGGSRGGLFNTWVARFGEERVKQTLLLGLLLLGIGVVGIIISQ
jgi:hypothetical protein